MKPPKIRGKTPRRVVEECRRDVLALLSSRPLTRNEIVEALGGRYPERTVEWCISKLRTMGVIRVLGRTAGDGRAIYAAANMEGWGEAMERYMPSKAWIREIRRRRVLEVLRQAEGWMSTRQIADATGMSIPQTIAVLRSLMGKGILMQRKGDGVMLWKIRG
jgi:DNA-binding transcriptional regulator GbsR (MarR family)